MFWGKNIKVNETVALDTEALLEKYLTIQTATLKESDESKYFLTIINKGESFQICCLDSKNNYTSISSSFIVEKGMKLKVEGGKKGTISLTGYVESLEDNEDLEEESLEEEEEEVPKKEAPKKQVQKKEEKKPVVSKKEEKKVEKEEEEEENSEDIVVESEEDSEEESEEKKDTEKPKGAKKEESSDEDDDDIKEDDDDDDE